MFKYYVWHIQLIIISITTRAKIIQNIDKGGVGRGGKGPHKFTLQIYFDPPHPLNILSYATRLSA